MLKKHSEATKRKLSEIGKTKIGKLNSFYGKNHTTETKKQISKVLKSKGIRPKEPYKYGKPPHNLAERHPNWKGGKLTYWKIKAKERDMGICQECGLHEPDIMEVDHIIPIWEFPEGKYLLSNLQVLCPNCHARKTLIDRRKFYAAKR